MASPDLKRLIENLKNDPKLVESFKGVGADTKAFAAKAKSLGYGIDPKDIDKYVEDRKREMSANVAPQSTGQNVAVVVLDGPSPIIYGPAQVVVVVVGPPPPVNVTAIVAQVCAVA
jgi:hypothetical protein